jgi:phenylalanyl-tRNA synthetase alpha chain
VNKTIEQIKEDALKEIEAAKDPESIKALSVRYLGRKGLVTQFLRNISSLPQEKRADAGKKANEVKKLLDTVFKKALKQLEAEPARSDDRIDVSLPGRVVKRGSLHPITQITQEICDIFSRLGFDIAEGPEVETDYYNFEALNIHKNHPARDMQDTFYISKNIVLRTHTSPTQPRIMEKRKPPLRVIAPGKVYRCDSDLTHTPMFQQVEGFLVDKKSSFGDLKGILTTFIHKIFDAQTSLRFRPSFFPFTEPGLKLSAQAWFILRCSKMSDMIQKFTPVLLLGWV